MKLLVWLKKPETWIRRVRPSGVLPNGLSLRKGREDRLFELCLVLPIFLVYKRHHYDLSWDRYVKGWFVLKFFCRFSKCWGAVVDIRLAFGLIKTKWIREA